MSDLKGIIQEISNDPDLKEFVLHAKKIAIIEALLDIEKWYNVQNAQHPANNPESKAYKKGWQKGVNDVIYILKQQLETLNTDEADKTMSFIERFEYWYGNNNHMLGEIKFDESEGHTVDGFLAAIDMLSDGENWTPIGELRANKPPDITSVGKMLDLPIDPFFAFRWGCIVPTNTTKRLEIDPHC